MGKIWISSDTHHSSDYIFKRESRPFDCVSAFDNYVVNTWNAQTCSGDLVYHLGDFFSYSAFDKKSWLEARKLPKLFHCSMVLVLGNNEERLIRGRFNSNFEAFREFCISIGFADVLEDCFISYEGYNFYLNHYPERHKRDVINLYGHIHLRNHEPMCSSYGMNIGCDGNTFSLYDMDYLVGLWKWKH